MKKYLNKYISLVETLNENQQLLLPIACLLLGIIIGFWFAPAKKGFSIWCDNTVGSNNGNCHNSDSSVDSSRSNYKNRRCALSNGLHQNTLSEKAKKKSKK